LKFVWANNGVTFDIWEMLTSALRILVKKQKEETLS